MTSIGDTGQSSWWRAVESVGFSQLSSAERLTLDELSAQIDELADELAQLKLQRRTLLDRARSREYRRLARGG